MTKKLLEKIIEEEKIVRKVKKTKDKENIKDFSWVWFFVGNEFSNILAQRKDINVKNIIDFKEIKNNKEIFIETKIKEIENSTENKKLITESKFPIIWFKNLEVIKNEPIIEKSLLPVFDPQQNTELFGKKVDLSNYILIATSSNKNISQLSLPLISRLCCVNIEDVKTKKFFLDEYFYSIFFISLFITIFMILYLYLSRKKVLIQNMDN